MTHSSSPMTSLPFCFSIESTPNRQQITFSRPPVPSCESEEEVFPEPDFSPEDNEAGPGLLNKIKPAFPLSTPDALCNLDELREITEIINAKNLGDVDKFPPKDAQGRKTVIVDLDETLVKVLNGSEFGIARSNAFTVSFRNSFGEIIETEFSIRPFAFEFLRKTSLYYDIILFTASTEEYAKAVLRCLDPERKLISNILSRKHCLRIGKSYIKDLKLTGRRLEKAILIDNSMAAFALQPRNGLYVPPYTGEPSDNALSKVLDFLEKIKDVDDIRSYLARFTGIPSNRISSN
eukprot:TRINITY_DN88921_c1_g1_i1.p1 TRINITY_DN88921_c1_g1~~TRINITY_DN88921_c1_g1_i1.p1  ORF type:complete len:292 (-),score=17.80 TRINITY_DN88921_c1_g1_i1:128-1003(-)